MSFLKNEFGFQLMHIHLEISSKCLLKCPRCPRTEFPQTPWINKQLDLKQVQKVLPYDVIQNFVERITICGDVGDPIYNSDFHKIIKYFKTVKPNIHLYIITNGSYKSEDWWNETGLLLNEYDTVAFSVDGYSDESNQKYRKNSDWESIEIAMRCIKSSKASMVWAAIAFRFNQDSLDKIRELAIERGCDYLQVTKSTKFGSKYLRYRGRNGEDVLEPDSDLVSSSHRFERKVERLSEKKAGTHQEFLNKMGRNYNSLERTYKDSNILPLCLVGNRGVYINVTGQMFPCSWVSFPFEKLLSEDRSRSITFDQSFFHLQAEAFNLLKNDFEKVLNSPEWKKLFSRLSGEKSEFIECQQKCSKKYMTEDYVLGWNLN